MTSNVPILTPVGHHMIKLFCQIWIPMIWLPGFILLDSSMQHLWYKISSTRWREKYIITYIVHQSGRCPINRSAVSRYVMYVLIKRMACVHNIIQCFYGLCVAKQSAGHYAVSAPQNSSKKMNVYLSRHAELFVSASRAERKSRTSDRRHQRPSTIISNRWRFHTYGAHGVLTATPELPDHLSTRMLTFLIYGYEHHLTSRIIHLGCE